MFDLSKGGVILELALVKGLSLYEYHHVSLLEKAKHYFNNTILFNHTTAYRCTDEVIDKKKVNYLIKRTLKDSQHHYIALWNTIQLSNDCLYVYIVIHLCIISNITQMKLNLFYNWRN